MVQFAIFPGNTPPTRQMQRLLRIFMGMGDVMLICENGDAYTNQSQSDSILPIVPLSCNDYLSADLSETVAVLTDPYWTAFALSAGPAFSIGLLVDSPPDEEEKKELWHANMECLAANTNLIAVTSESLYLELSFRHPSICLLHSDRDESFDIIRSQDELLLLNESETIWKNLIQAVLHEESLASTTSLQRKLRTQHYLLLREEYGPHETISYLLSVYCYFIGDFDEAAQYLTEAFEQCVLSGRSNSVATHYRFLSAIELESDIRKAAAIYEISVQTDEEKIQAKRIIDWINAGKTELAKALLYRYNDDYLHSCETLQHLDDPHERELLMQNYMDMGLFNKALQLQQEFPEPRIISRAFEYVLQGKTRLLSDSVTSAIHSFLQAAEIDQSAIHHILEIGYIHNQITQFLREGRPYLDFLQKNCRQQADCDDSGAQRGESISP